MLFSEKKYILGLCNYLFLDEFWEIMKKKKIICKVTCLVIFDLFDQFTKFQRL